MSALPHVFNLTSRVGFKESVQSLLQMKDFFPSEKFF